VSLPAAGDGPTHTACWTGHWSAPSTGCPEPCRLRTYVSISPSTVPVLSCPERLLLDELERCELRGHGGGWFPVATKWRRVATSAGDGVVVANGAESEPASAKDAVILQLHPHLVLDGLTYAAESVHASEAVVWMHQGARDTYRAVARAIAERYRSGLRDLSIRIEVAPNRYLSGESSAIISALEGGPVLPRHRVEPGAVVSAGGRPTLVHNVETLARVGLLARTGARDYEATMMTTVATESARIVLEVETGSSTLAVAQEFSARPVAAALVGGFGGTWLSREQLARTPMGPAVGAGILVPIGGETCGLAVTAEIVAYLAASGAGQCGPCLFGLPAAAQLFAEIAGLRAGTGVQKKLRRYLDEINGRGACHHPDGTVRLAESALRTFADDVAAHSDGRCEVGSGAGFFPSAVGRGNS